MDEEKKGQMFTESKNEMAYFKCALQGFSGAGKTFTASKIAIGLHKFINSKKPIGFIDTETGSDFVLPLFKEEKIKLMSVKSRAFSDLIDACKFAEKNYDILIIDSITHFWTELQESFMKKRNLSRIALYHWMELKRDWRLFSDFYINSKLHIIFCGRAGWEFDDKEDENGVTQLSKTGTKMKVEGETGFEPSLLLEMQRERSENKIGAALINRCWVLKDRTNTIQSKCFNKPKFEDFLPHIKCLNIGGEHKAIDTTRTSESFHGSDRSAQELYKQKQITIELIKDELDLRFSNKSDTEKKKRIEVLKEVFKTSSSTAIENLNLDILLDGLEKIKLLPKGEEK